MFTRNFALAACIGVMGATLQASPSHAMTIEECDRLQPNQYLAAIERGECEIVDIETAAGPDQSAFGSNGSGVEVDVDDHDKERTGRNGGSEGGNGGNGGGGGNRGGGNRGGVPGRP